MKTKTQEGKERKESVKYIKIPDWIYYGSERVVLRYKNPDGEYMQSEFYPMDYEEVETEQKEYFEWELSATNKAMEVRERFWRTRVEQLIKDYPYRGKAIVNITKDGVKYRAQILEAMDTKEGLWIEGRI